MVKYFYNQENNEILFKIETKRNNFTYSTTVNITGPETRYTCRLKVGGEAEIINNMIWSIGYNPTIEEAIAYFRNHKEKI